MCRGTESEEQNTTIPNIGNEKNDVIVCLASSACGSYAAALSGKTIALLDVASGKVLAKRYGTRVLTPCSFQYASLCSTLSRRGTSITFAQIPTPTGPAEAVLLSTDANSEVRAWPLPALDKNVLLLGHAMSLISCASAHPSGHLLATGDREGRVRLTTLPASGLLQGMLFWHKRFLTNVTWVPSSAASGSAPSGTGAYLLLTAAADGCLALWDAESTPPCCLGTASAVQHLSSSPIAAPAAAAAAAAAPARAYPQESNAELMRRASGSKPRTTEDSTPLSHVIRKVVVVGSTVVVAVFGIPQLLFFSMTWNTQGVSQSDPGKADEATAMKLDYVGRASIPAPVVDMEMLVDSSCSEPAVLLALGSGAVAAVGVDSRAVIPSAAASKVSAALEEQGVTAEQAASTDSFVPSPFDMAFAGGAVPPKALKQLVSNSAAEAEAFLQAQGK